MKEISKSQFEQESLEYFRKVQETGEALIITEDGKPVIKITPYIPAVNEPLKDLRDSVLNYENPLEPVAQEDWVLLD